MANPVPRKDLQRIALTLVLSSPSTAHQAKVGARFKPAGQNAEPKPTNYNQTNSLMYQKVTRCNERLQKGGLS